MKFIKFDDFVKYRLKMIEEKEEFKLEKNYMFEGYINFNPTNNF